MSKDNVNNILKIYNNKINRLENVNFDKTFFHDVFNISFNFTNLMSFKKSIRTGNSFLYNFNGDQYLISTTHLLFDENKSIETEKATIIKFNKNELTNYCYSRFFDILVFKLDKFHGKAFNSNLISNLKDKNAFVKYKDSFTGNKNIIKSKYFKILNSSIEMFGLNKKLIVGSSGAAVTDHKGKLIGMVSSGCEKYNNTTLFIPSKIIQRIIETNNCLIGGNDYDKTKFYPGLITFPLSTDYLNFLPKSIKNGEIVEISDIIDNIKPFDIITSINNIKLGEKTKISSEALLNNKLEAKVRKLNNKWRSTFGALPRCAFYRIINNKKYILRGIQISNLDEVTIDQNKIKININTKSKNELLSKEGCGLLYKDLIYPGSLIKFKDNDKNVFFSGVLSIDIIDNQSVITVDKNLKNIDQLIIYPLTTIYTSNANNNVTGVYDIIVDFDGEDNCNPESETEITICNQRCNCAILNNKSYKKYILLFIVKYWGNLVCKDLNKVQIGYQHIIWANECKRLLKTINKIPDLDTRIQLVMNIFYKLLEFNNVNVMNLLNIFLQNLINFESLPLKEVEKLVYFMRDFFPILDDTNNLNTSITFFGEKIKYSTNPSTGGTPFIKYEGVICFDEKDNKLFQVIKVLDNQTIEIKLYKNVNVDTFYIKSFDQINEREIVYSYNIEEKERMINIDNINGDTSFNAEGFSSEFFHANNSLTEAKSITNNNHFVNVNIELCYKELEYIVKDSTDFGTDKLYYPRFLNLLKFFWDNAYLNIGGILGSIKEEDFENEKIIELNNFSLPDKLKTWNYTYLYTNSNLIRRWMNKIGSS